MYQQRHRSSIDFQECKVPLEKASLVMNIQVLHGRPVPMQAPPPVVLELADYFISFSKTRKSIICPFCICVVKETIHNNMWMHFMHFHVQEYIVIFQEGTSPHPWCEVCDMFFMKRDLNCTHRCTNRCAKGVDSKCRYHADKYSQRSLDVVLSYYGRYLDSFSVLKYLVIILSYDNI